MSDRVEYWWVTWHSDVQPAEVVFRGGIPFHVRLIGSADVISATDIDLMERLPLAPAPVIREKTVEAPAESDRSIKLLWLIGFIVITLILWFSGNLFDAIK
ncbi:hypothetical protein [Microvirga pudoricolor]|uniref:hypothetical protein n=1 Tax=Microvirga pudoricolor TaxID=2778729 RepID=UPI0019515AAD|nr:hypothetical protein [Microvirga pudoricolor]MBM6594269.1 hypothetical protein [Microvirga pudoricolor]